MENSAAPTLENIAHQEASYDAITPVGSGTALSNEASRGDEGREENVNEADSAKLAYGAVHRLAHILVEIARKSTIANDGKDTGISLDD